MIIRIFKTELRRSFLLSITLLISALITGYAATSAVIMKTHIENMFAPVVWDADLIILPKGVSVDDLHRSILAGKPAGLIPQALYKTLEAQVEDEAKRRGLNQPSLEILGFIPLKKDGQSIIAYFGPPQAYFKRSREDSIWSARPRVEWATESAGLLDKESYRTDEWGTKVLMGILVRGEPAALESLQILIDRRTVAQAWVVKKGESKTDVRQAMLSDALTGLTVLILVSLLPALTLSYLVLRERRKTIETVLHEIGAARLSTRLTALQQLAGLQFVCLIIAPIFAGIILGIATAPMLKNILS